MGHFGEHGQLRWDPELGAQYNVLWSLNDNESFSNGYIGYELGESNGNIYPTIETIARGSGMSITHALDAGSVLFSIADGTRLETQVGHDQYNLAIVSGYTTPAEMPAGRYPVAGAYVTALPHPLAKTRDKVDEADRFSQNFGLTISTAQTPAPPDLQMCVWRKQKNGQYAWEPLPATMASKNGVMVQTNQIGFFVLTSNAQQTTAAINSPSAAWAKSLAEKVDKLSQG